MRPLVISACADEKKRFLLVFFSVGAVGRHFRDVTRVVGLLLGTSECSGFSRFDPLAMSVVGVSVGAVRGCRQSETDVVFDVGVVRRNLGDEVRVTSSFVGVDAGLFSKSVGVGCTLGAEAPR